MMPLVQTEAKQIGLKRWYRTWEVSRETGASHRQLQWWDERRILQPDKIKNHARLYTKEQLEQARRLVMLRKAGVSLQEIRRRKLLTLPGLTCDPVGGRLWLGIS